MTEPPRKPQRREIACFLPVYDNSPHLTSSTMVALSLESAKEVRFPSTTIGTAIFMLDKNPTKSDNTPVSSFNSSNINYLQNAEPARDTVNNHITNTWEASLSIFLPGTIIHQPASLFSDMEHSIKGKKTTLQGRNFPVPRDDSGTFSSSIKASEGIMSLDRGRGALNLMDSKEDAQSAPENTPDDIHDLKVLKSAADFISAMESFEHETENLKELDNETYGRQLETGHESMIDGFNSDSFSVRGLQEQSYPEPLHSSVASSGFRSFRSLSKRTNKLWAQFANHESPQLPSAYLGTRSEDSHPLWVSGMM